MIRVLMIAYTVYSRDGRVKRHAEALAERGDWVDVICLEGEPPQRSRGVRLIGIPIARYRGRSHARYLRSYLTFFSRAAAAAVRFSRSSHYDVVIVCTMPDLAILSALPLRAFGSKLLLDVHDTMPELYREKFAGRSGAAGARLLMMGERLSTALADRVLAVHEPHCARLMAAGVPAGKIRVVINSPDHSIFQSLPSAPLSGDDFTIACHGTLTRRLGLDVAVRALAIVRRKLPDVRLKLIGEGDYAIAVRELVHELGLDSAVIYRPPVPIEALPAELAGAAAGLVPNRQSAATHLMLPVKLLEYAALGIPILSSRLRTVENYFSSRAVIYFEPGDPTSLADAIERLYQRPDRGAAMAEHARTEAAQFGWQEQRLHLFEAVDSMLGKRPAGGDGQATTQRDRQSQSSNESGGDWRIT
jgi:glycosyltransferase involved in cell wall biosynthesis